MKYLAAVCMSVLLTASVGSDAFGWGAVSGPRGGAAYRGPMGGAAVRTPSGPGPFADPMAAVQFAVLPATTRCAARSTAGPPSIAAALMAAPIMAAGSRRRRGWRGRRGRGRCGGRDLEPIITRRPITAPRL